MLYAIYLAVGIVTGIMAGIFGVGGGIVLIPILAYFMHMAQHRAQGVILVALLLPTGILGVIEYYKKGFISPSDVAIGLAIAVGLFIGIYFGARIAVPINDVLLRRLFGGLLLLVSVRMIFWGR
jgi:hypothetical protein